MPADAYDQWGSRHATLFAMRSEDDMLSVRSWVHLFRESGITAVELYRASDWLALHQPPKWASEHLPALKECVERFRQQAASKRPSEWPTDLGECMLCHNAGMVSVPNPRHITDGKPYSTCAVRCRCALGRWIGTRQGGQTSAGEKRPALMHLDDYEQIAPNWRKIIEQHDIDAQQALRALRGPRNTKMQQEWQDAVERVCGR